MNSGTTLPPRSASRNPEPVGSPKKKPKQNNKSKFRWGRFFLLLLLAIVLLIGGYAGYIYWTGMNALNEIDITDNGTLGNDVVVPPGDSVKHKAVTMLLLGLDTRKRGGGLNTDVMMVATLNPDTKSAVVVSIPRDTKIVLDRYSARKANAYYARFHAAAKDKNLKGVEAETYARDEMKLLMSRYFGLPVDYTAIINFNGFTDIVDALGGIDVNVDMDMKYTDTWDGTVIDLDKGFQHLDGDKTLDFVRYRHSKDGSNMSSDFQRNQRQSAVLGEMADQMKSLNGVASLADIINAIGGNLTMDMPAPEIKNMMTTYFGINKESIQFIPLEGVWRSPYVYPDETKLEQIRAALKAKAAE
jgi:LCP family protein required for cell wall assembly